MAEIYIKNNRLFQPVISYFFFEYGKNLYPERIAGECNEFFRE
jgi:hypothetical protein